MTDQRARGMDETLRTTKGRAWELTNLVLKCCRTMGIPAAADYLEWWHDCEGNYMWPAYYDGKKWVPYGAVANEPTPEQWIYNNRFAQGAAAKIYRTTYQQRGPGIIDHSEWVLATDGQKKTSRKVYDVTSDYAHTCGFRTSTFQITGLPQAFAGLEGKAYLYINAGWNADKSPRYFAPVTASVIENGVATFKDVAGAPPCTFFGEQKDNGLFGVFVQHQDGKDGRLQVFRTRAGKDGWPLPVQTINASEMITATPREGGKLGLLVYSVPQGGWEVIEYATDRIGEIQGPHVN